MSCAVITLIKLSWKWIITANHYLLNKFAWLICCCDPVLFQLRSVFNSSLVVSWLTILYLKHVINVTHINKIACTTKEIKTCYLLMSAINYNIQLLMFNMQYPWWRNSCEQFCIAVLIVWQSWRSLQASI